MAVDNNSSLVLKRGKLSLAISSACAGIAPGAMAQDANQDADEGAVSLPEIIVTATKRGEASIQDIPMSIAAFTDADIVKAGFKQLDDYVGQIPALSSARREPGGSNVIMRGCATSGVAFADTQSTSLYFDEQPISVAGVNPDPRLVDISRIESLSGPQGTLFGDSSQCGTLRIITNKPDTTAFSGWVDLTGSSIQDGDTGYDISAMVNIPFADNKAALRLVGFSAEEAGYVDNVLGLSPGGVAVDDEGVPYAPGGTFDNAEFAEQDINSTTVTGGRLGLRIAPGDNWTLDLQAAFQNTEADGFGDVDLAEAFHAGDSLGEWEQMRFGDEYWEEEWYQTSISLEGSLGWADLTVTGSFLNRTNVYEVDSTAYLSAWQEFYPDKSVYALYDFGGDPQAMSFEDSEQDRTSLEIRLSTPADSDSRWNGVIGAFYNKSEDHTHFSANVRQMAEGVPAFYYNNYAFYECVGPGDVDEDGYCTTEVYDVTSALSGQATPTVKWWDGVYDSELEQVALFGEATIDINEYFSLTVGGRWFDIKSDRELGNGTLVPWDGPFDEQGPAIDCSASGDVNVNGTALPNHICWTGVTNLADSDESGFVPKVTATFNVGDDSMIYATYSEGFRRGGGNAARPTSVFGPGGDFNQYESDLVKNFEVGTKNTFAGGRFQFNLTLYHMTWEDMQVEVEDPTPNVFTLGLINVAEAELTGAEAFLSWAASDRTVISANIGVNEAELSKSFLIFDDLELAKGTQLPLTPDWKASIVLDHEFDGELLGSVPSLGITYNATGDSVSSLAGIASTEVLNPIRKQPSYSIANVRLGLANESWSATLFVNNVTNEYAEQYFNDRWIQQRLTVNQPRTFGINFRKNFQ